MQHIKTLRNHHQGPLETLGLLRNHLRRLLVQLRLQPEVLQETKVQRDLALEQHQKSLVRQRTDHQKARTMQSRLQFVFIQLILEQSQLSRICLVWFIEIQQTMVFL